MLGFLNHNNPNIWGELKLKSVPWRLLDIIISVLCNTKWKFQWSAELFSACVWNYSSLCFALCTMLQELSLGACRTLPVWQLLLRFILLPFPGLGSGLGLRLGLSLGQSPDGTQGSSSGKTGGAVIQENTLKQHFLSWFKPSLTKCVIRGSHTPI